MKQDYKLRLAARHHEQGKGQIIILIIVITIIIITIIN